MQYARYNDISKFRAPYKYGVYSGFGAQEGAPAVPGPLELLKAFTVPGPGGSNVFSPAAANEILLQIVGSILIPNTTDTGGFLQRIDATTPPENVKNFGAAAWVDKKTQAGKSIIGTVNMLLPDAPQIVGAKAIAAIDPSQEAAATKAGTGFAVLRSGPKGLFATLGPTGVVVGVLVVGGIIYAVTRKRKG